MKEKRFAELCKEVEKCNICKNIMFTPHLLDSNCFVKEAGSASYINRWNIIQGSLDADIMVIGQDYGNSNETNFVTDKYLKRLIFDVFGIDIENKSSRLFFTNVANCYRKNKSTGVINTGCLALCANKFMSRLIDIISPKVIVALGQRTFEALACCENARLICKNPTNKCDNKDNFETIIGFDYCLVLGDNFEIPVFPVYHPGSNSNMNRPYEKQRNDWLRVKNYLDNYSGGKRKHFVYHHNMFGPSCEVAGVNRPEDFEIYCHLEHKVCAPTKCNDCEYHNHSEMGNGICCYWEEFYENVSDEHYTVQNSDAYLEFERVERNMKNHLVSANNAHKYDKYRENFIKAVKEMASRPNLYNLDDCVVWPDDDADLEIIKKELEK